MPNPAEIEEFRRWSKQMTIRLMDTFPVSKDPENISYDADDSELPTLSTLLGPDIYRDANSRPAEVKRSTQDHLWRRKGLYLARGFHAFVLLQDKTVVIGKHGHDQISRGQDVHFAGEVLFKAGELLFWTNNSGHYKPHPMLATAMPFPIHRYSDFDSRQPWVVGEALKVTKNIGRIARWLNWTPAEVLKAVQQLR